MIRLLRTNASRYQSLDAGHLKARFDRLQTLLSNASPATKSAFAEPALVQGLIMQLAHPKLAQNLPECRFDAVFKAFSKSWRRFLCICIY